MEKSKLDVSGVVVILNGISGRVSPKPPQTVGIYE